MLFGFVLILKQINEITTDKILKMEENPEQLVPLQSKPKYLKTNWMVLGKVGFLVTTNIGIPLIDIITDLITTFKHFIRYDYFWGIFSALFILMPSILALVFNQFQVIQFFNHLPILQQIKHWRIVKKILDIEKNKEITKQKSILETSTFWTSRYANDYLQFEKELKLEKSQLQRRKVYETFGESVPQFILQLSIIMKTSRYQDWWTLLSICISLFTTVLNVSNLIGNDQL